MQVVGDARGWGQEQDPLEDLYVMAAEGKLTCYQLRSPQPGGPVGSSELLGTPTQAAASPRCLLIALKTYLGLRECRRKNTCKGHDRIKL